MVVFIVYKVTNLPCLNNMTYSRTLSDEHRRKISDSKKGYRHTEQAKKKISDGVRKAWARIPIDPQGEITLNINYDENNKNNFKVYLNDGTEITK